MATPRPLLDGTEPFHRAGRPADFTILDFWRWADSDLLSNALRGRLAEFLVARALDLPFEPRREWMAYDLMTRDDVKIEVKSSAYVQGWFQEKLLSDKPVRGVIWGSEKLAFQDLAKVRTRRPNLHHPAGIERASNEAGAVSVG